MKPYAWINVNDEYKILFDDELPTYYPEAWMPLYTHPAKTLTDEEMLEVYKKVFNKKNEFKENLKRRSYFNFAKAILRKAQDE
jgi:hypothetical protein